MAVELKDLADFAILDLRGEGIGLSTVSSFSHLYSSFFCTAADFLLQLSNEQSAESCALTHYLILAQ